MKTILFVLAHNDDEYFIIQKIHTEMQRGNKLLFIYTTYGCPSGIDPTIRINETINTLAKFNIPKENIITTGLDLDIFVNCIHENLETSYKHIIDILKDEKIEQIISLAWEGGQHDHDSTHLLAAALAKKFNVTSNFYEFCIYNGYNLRGHFFNVGRFIPSENQNVSPKLTIKQVFSYLPLFLKYRSQRKTFLFLFPFIFMRMALLRTQPIRKVPNHIYTSRPHPKYLYYERHFNVPFETFINKTRPFIEEYLNE
jgi:LmbE family N-acetylglucosaminyl deacetylase